MTKTHFNNTNNNNNIKTMKMEIGKLSEQAIENLKKLESEVPMMSGNLEWSSITVTNKTEDE